MSNNQKTIIIERLIEQLEELHDREPTDEEIQELWESLEEL